MSPRLVPAEPIARGRPLREAVYARIVRLILSAEYPPGSVLTEASLSRAMAVSRTPVREALLRLEAEGILTSSLARGFAVRGLTRSDAAELYPVLAALEALAVRTAQPLDTAAKVSLRVTLDELEDCADAVRRWQLDTTWHGTLTAACGNSRLQGFVTQLRTSLSRYELSYMQHVPTREGADREHREILAAVEMGHLHQAADLIDRHWRGGQVLVMDWLSD